MVKIPIKMCAVLCVATMGAAVCAGCSTTVSEEPNMQAPVQDVATPETASLGIEVEGASSFVITNDTKLDVVGVSIKSSDAADFPANVMKSGQTFKAGETVNLYCPAISVSSASAERDIVLRPTADIRITFADGAVKDLHQLNLADIKDATVAMDGDLAYIAYTSISNGEKMSTLESEKAIVQAAADAQAAAEEQRAAEAQAEELAQQKEVIQAPVDNGYGAGYQGGYVDSGISNYDPSLDSSVGSGSEDACVDDLVLR